MRKITYLTLQKKYPGQIVALDRDEKYILAVGKKFEQIFKKLEKKNLKPKNCVFVGPIQKAGTINVYLLSLRKKSHR